MNIGKPRFISIILFTVCITFFFSSCNNDNPFVIGEDFVESSTNLAIVDTFTVEMSTIVQDSVPTSGSEGMLIGIYSDTLFGNARCSSFFRIGLPESISLDEKDVYDSISIIFRSSGYSYGDTTGMIQINVHRLTESIEDNENGVLYNTSEFAYDPELLGRILIRAAPDTANSVEIKLTDAIGLELFSKFVNHATEITTEVDFMEYFKGIALLPDESSGNAILGFIVTAEQLKLRLYTHRIEQTDIATAYDLPVVYTNLQFNHIDYDLSGTPLAYATDERTPIPSTVTGNQTFVQGYKKIMTRMRFPSLADIILNERGIVMKAELVFEPVKGSYKGFELPDFVILYETNRKNQPLNLVYSANGNVQTAVLVVDNQYHEETTYTFDITDFVTDEIADGYFDTDHGLLISLYNQSYQLNFERIVIETQRPAPKLRIYYMTY